MYTMSLLKAAFASALSWEMTRQFSRYEPRAYRGRRRRRRFDDHRIANTFGMSAARIHIVAQRAVRSPGNGYTPAFSSSR